MSGTDTMPAAAADALARWRMRAADAARKACTRPPASPGYDCGFWAGESAAYEVAAAELPRLVEQLVAQLTRPARPVADDGEE